MIEGAAQVEQADDRAFQEEVLAGEEPVLVSVHAGWCAPCRALDPQLERLARELGGRLRVVRLDADRNKHFMERYGVKGLPTCLLLQRGEEVLRIAGVHPYHVFKTHVEKTLA